MNVLNRRRVMSKYINIPADYARIIVRGVANERFEYLQYSIFDRSYPFYVDGQLATPNNYWTFEDNSFHEFWFKQNLNNQTYYIKNNTVVVDLPDIIYFNQELRRDFNTTEPHVDVILRGGYVDVYSSWLVYGWDKTKVALYVPQSLISQYEANVYYSKGTITTIEGSKYEKRNTPIGKLNLL